MHTSIVSRIGLTMDIFMFRKKKSYTIAVFFTLAACVLMIVFSELAVLSAKKGISLWLSNVLPAMLPFFICVNFLTYIGVATMLPVQVFPFAMSVLSGYPMGAKIIGDFCRNGIISKGEAKWLITFCSTSNPVFMIGAVGTEMLGMQKAGVLIALSHYLGAVCNGLCYSFFSKKESVTKSLASEKKDYDVLEQLTNAIFSAFKSLGIILAYIIMFMFLSDLLDYMGVFQFFDDSAGESLVRGIFEMTVGCSYLDFADVFMGYKCVLATMIISWSGLSIIGQSMSMLSGTGISLMFLIMTKLSHCFFAGIIALFLGKLML